MTTPAVSTTLTYAAVVGATNYRWRVTNISTSQVTTLNRNSTSTSWSLVSFSATVNTAYTIEVAALVGGVWGPYGTVCTVTTGPVQFTPSDPSSEFREEEDIDGSFLNTLSVYPNPALDNVTISVGVTGAEYAEVCNTLGELMMRLKLENGSVNADVSMLSPGIYLVVVRTSDGIMTSRL